MDAFDVTYSMRVSLLLLGVVVLYMLYYIGRQVFAGMQHPDDETLLDFYNGRLDKDDRPAYRSTTEHLGYCEECRDRLDVLIASNKGGPGSEEPLISRRY